MESSRRPHSSNQFLFSLFACQQTQSKQQTAAKMVPDSKGVEHEQVWHQVNNTTVGLELMGANVVRDCLTKKKPKMHQQGVNPQSTPWSKCAAENFALSKGLELKS